MSCNYESQQFELISLQSIYNEDEFVVENQDPARGYVTTEVLLPDSFYVTIGGQIGAAKHEDVFQVNHLPPIILHFEFPSTYPHKHCPSFFLTCEWLSSKQLSALCGQLKYLWEENKDVILYIWMQFLKEEALNFLKIGDFLDISQLIALEAKDNFEQKVTIINDSSSGTGTISSEFFAQATKAVSILSGFDKFSATYILMQILKDYNDTKTQSVFDANLLECKVCFERKLGSEFIQFNDCRHLFCKGCVKDYFEGLIKDGQINNLKCLQEDCNTQLDSNTIKKLVGTDFFEKYDKLLLFATFDNMPDIAFCPRTQCQKPCVIEMELRVAKCSLCDLAFCPFCRKVYHGVNPCDYGENMKDVYERYMTGNHSVKEGIKKKYGKRFVDSLVNDTLSENWKNLNCRRCPHCHTAIVKENGCNKMVCYQCDTVFCWLCLKKITDANPYEHFINRANECYQQLFPPEDVYRNDADEEEEVVVPGQYLADLYLFNHVN